MVKRVGRSMTWSEAHSLDDVGQVTALWLLGRLPMHPNQPASPDEETTSIRAALVRLNRAGFVTDFSQPGQRGMDGSGQRAAVSGFCSKEIALRLASLTLCSELIVLAYPPGSLRVCQIPITVDDYHPFTWLGSFDPEAIECFHGLGMEAHKALLSSWWVGILDPRWGRERYLWRETWAALRADEWPFRCLPITGTLP